MLLGVLEVSNDLKSFGFLNIVRQLKSSYTLYMSDPSEGVTQEIMRYKKVKICTYI